MVALRIAAGACLLALIVPAAGSAAERAKAKVTCRPAGEHLVYDCTIMLTGRKSGAPIAGAKITVSAIGWNIFPSTPVSAKIGT